MSRMLTRLRNEDGVVGGVEVLPFGVLVFVVGTLIVLYAWAVVDAKLAVAAAAREGARAYVETPAGADPRTAAAAAVQRSLAAVGRTARTPQVTITGSFERCSRVTVSVGYGVPALRLPWMGDIGATTARSTASEIVDPLRSGLGGTASCVG